MNLLFQSDFLKSLGWSLFDSLWQMGVLWLAYHLIAGTVKLTAARRYNLALLSLKGGTLLFLGGFLSRSITGSALETSMEQWAINLLSVPKDNFESLLPVASLVYIVITGILIMRIFVQVYQTKVLGTQGLSKAAPELRVFVQQLSGQMGIKRTVKVYFSNLVDSPLTIGFFKPLILLPVAAINNLNIQQTEAILLHELEHIRRNDYLVNLFVVLSESVFFFNPFARSLANIIRKERENSCDDKVLDFNYGNSTYASALLILEKTRLNRNLAYISAVGTHKFLLLNRVERIMTGKQISRPNYVRNSFGVLFLALLSLLGLYQKNKDEMRIKAISGDPKVLWKINNQFGQPGSESLFERADLPKLVLTTRSPDEINLLEELHPDMQVSQVSYFEEIEDPADLVEFASSVQTRNFSILEPPTPPTPPDAPGIHPYIPANSFDFELVEDTLMPALKNTITVHQLRAKEALERAIVQLEEECKKNEGLEALMEVELAKMRKELSKTMEQINWAEMEKQIALAKEQTANNQRLQAEFEKFHKNKVLHQEKINKLKEQILLDRLNIKEKKVVVL